MPFDGSGNFTRSYNWVTDKGNGVKIVASRMDGEFDNFATALNQTFLRSGVVAMSGNLALGGNLITGIGNGAVGTPAIRFTTDATTGIYMPASGEVALTAGGVQRVKANATGVVLTGATDIVGALTVSTTIAATGNVTGANLSGTNTGDQTSIVGITGTLAQFNTALSGADFASLAGAETLTNKTVDLASNTLTGTLAQFNAALSGADFASLAGAETLTNKSINLANNTVTTTLALLNTAVSDADIASLAGTENLTNKTLTDPVIQGTVTEDVFTITDGAAFEIDPGNGSIQIIVLGASRTPKATNFANGESVTMAVDDGTAFALTWTDATFGGTGVKWVGGSAPVLATSGYTWITLWKVAGQVYGSSPGSTA